jgi:hypothetical protein
MVRNSDKTYGSLVLEAQTKTDRQDVGETLEPILRQLKGIIEECIQQQAEQCSKKGFYLPKYYIHIFIVKDPQANIGQGAPNVLRIRKPHCRVTRPSPYQDADHYLWSVTNLNEVKFEWCIPDKNTVRNILANPQDFHPDYVANIRKYVRGDMDKLEGYLVGSKIA